MTSQDIYVMRVWHEGEREAWRVTITDTKNQEKKHFATLETLMQYLQERLEPSAIKPSESQSQKPH